MHHNNIKHHINWNEHNEQLLKTWGETAKCFKIMHYQAYKDTWKKNAMFKIPTIIISTIIGATSLLTMNIDEDMQIYFMNIIGCIAIMNSILLSISTFMEYSQNLEGHRIAYVTWGKFSRKVQIELSKKRLYRVSCNEYITNMAREYDHIYDSSPILTNYIITWFNEKFHSTTGIEIPDIIGDLKPILIDTKSDSSSDKSTEVLDNEKNKNCNDNIIYTQTNEINDQITNSSTLIGKNSIGETENYTQNNQDNETWIRKNKIDKINNFNDIYIDNTNI